MSHEDAIRKYRLAIVNRQSHELCSLLLLVTVDELTQSRATSSDYNVIDHQNRDICLWNRFTTMHLLVLFESAVNIKAALARIEADEQVPQCVLSALRSPALSRCTCWNHRERKQSYAGPEDVQVVIALLLAGARMRRHHMLTSRTAQPASASALSSFYMCAPATQTCAPCTPNVARRP